jgi:hypothetical protein
MHGKFPSDSSQGGGDDTSQAMQESRVIWGEACEDLGDGRGGRFLTSKLLSDLTWGGWICHLPRGARTKMSLGRLT